MKIIRNVRYGTFDVIQFYVDVIIYQYVFDVSMKLTTELLKYFVVSLHHVEHSMHSILLSN